MVFQLKVLAFIFKLGVKTYEPIQTFDENSCDVWDTGLEDFHGGPVHPGGEELFGVFVVPVEGLGLYVQLQYGGVLVLKIQQHTPALTAQRAALDSRLDAGVQPVQEA